MHTLLVFLSIIGGLQLFGILGVILDRWWSPVF